MNEIELKSYLGFTDNIKEPRKTKVENILSHMYSYEGNVYNNVEFLCVKLIHGHIPEKEDNVQYYKRNGELSKPKTEYRFFYPDRSRYFELNKTQYDFVLYLIDNSLTTKESILVKEKQETEKRKLAERLESERIQKEKEEEERKAKEEQDFREWMFEESQNIPEELKELVNNVFTSMYGEANGSRLNYTLVVCINNYDKPLCKREVMDRLHNDNKASIKIFECLTGLKLPKGYKDRMVYLESITSADFHGMTEYKPRKKAEQKKDVVMETFYIFCGSREGCFWKPMKAEPLKKYGHEFFIFKDGDSYNISHAETGSKVVKAKTKKECMNRLKRIMETMREQFEHNAIEMKRITEEKAGKNPKYKEVA